MLIILIMFASRDVAGMSKAQEILTLSASSPVMVSCNGVAGGVHAGKESFGISPGLSFPKFSSMMRIV